MNPRTNHGRIIMDAAWCVPAAVCLWSVSVCSLLALEPPQGVMARLGADEFAAREAAQEELMKWSLKRRPESLKWILQKSRTASCPEQRERCLMVLREIIGMDYAQDGPGFLGVQMGDRRIKHPEEAEKMCQAVVISRVLPGMAAEKAGLKQNDMIIALNGEYWDKELASIAFRRTIMGTKAGVKVSLRVMRGNEAFDMDVVLGRRPILADNPHLERFPERLKAAEEEARDLYIRRRLDEMNGGE